VAHPAAFIALLAVGALGAALMLRTIWRGLASAWDRAAARRS